MLQKNTRLATTTHQNQDLTIIICTFNRAHLLPYCLDALLHQSLAPSQYSIFVVDNNSSDETATVVKSYADRFPQIHLIHAATQGSGAARNAGIAQAKTKWILFLDDDAKAHPDLLEKTLLTTQQWDFDCFGGVYFPWYLYGKPAWLDSDFGNSSLVLPSKIGYYEGFLSAGILACKKEALDAVGGFPTHIGMIAGKTGYGEETLLITRFRESGFRIGINPTMKMDHLVNTYKLSPSWFLKSNFAYGRDYWEAFQVKKSLSAIIKVNGKRLYNTLKRIPSILTGKLHIATFCLHIACHVAHFFGMMSSFFSKNQ